MEWFDSATHSNVDRFGFLGIKQQTLLGHSRCQFKKEFYSLFVEEKVIKICIIPDPESIH